MADELAEVVSWGSEVSLEDVAVAAASAYGGLVPGDGANSAEVSMEGSDEFAMDSVPNLSGSGICSNS